MLEQVSVQAQAEVLEQVLEQASAQVQAGILERVLEQVSAQELVQFSGS